MISIIAQTAIDTDCNKWMLQLLLRKVSFSYRFRLNACIPNWITI